MFDNLTVAVDPGTTGNLAFAVFNHGKLINVGRGEDQLFAWLHYAVNALVFECPEFYRARMSKADPNKLAKLVRQIGFIHGRFLTTRGWLRVYEYLPKTWKGNAPKQVTAQRVARVLDSDELKRIPNNASHDIWDAIGLGLYHFHRLTPNAIKGESHE